MTAERQEDLNYLQKLEYPWPHLLRDACDSGNVAAASEVVAALSAQGDSGSKKAMLRSVLDLEDMIDALWIATTKGHLELCQMLFEAEADVDTASAQGITCLMIACRKGHTAIAKELLNR